jgi:signal transduction histidine kinase
LASVKRIVELHHGRVWLESEAGRGSTFLFTLPLAREGTDKAKILPVSANLSPEVISE